MGKMRLDTLLVQRGLAASAEEALRLVLAHKVKVGDAYANSAAQMVAADAGVQVKDAPRFVSRGGEKLAAALEHFGQGIEGLRCIDVGCSTGGFSDCLLQAGAAHVACVDVGYGDLAWKVRSDSRTAVFERTNIRTADPSALGAPFDLVVADVSFIGLASLAGVFARLCAPGGVFLGLVKPQFESAHDETKSGYVADPAVRQRTVDEVSQALGAVGFRVTGVYESPVPGKKAHNIEYFVSACLGSAVLPNGGDADAASA